MTAAGGKRAVAICLMGPTASGKTGLAVDLAQRMPADIVSVDSALVYRGLDIGTAKPGPEELSRAPHLLIDILDPAEAYSAAQFRIDALREMESIRRRRHVPLLVGGTMLYYRALERGLSPLPVADQAVRERLDDERARVGLPGMHRRLASIDPAAALRIHPNDSQRIQRALEVYELTGYKLSELHSQAARPACPFRLVKLVVAPADRSVLHQRIESRLDAMLAAGFVDEVRELKSRGDLSLELPSMRAVGYRQVWEHLNGTYDHEEMRRRVLVATRQLARRQLTWLRAEPGCTWLDPADPGMSRRLSDTLASAGLLLRPELDGAPG